MRRLAAIAILLAPTVLGATGCATQDAFPEQTFELERMAEKTAEIRIHGLTSWHTNVAAAGEYSGWTTQYDNTAWTTTLANVSLAIAQTGSYPKAIVTLDGHPPLTLSGLDIGIGWLGIQRTQADAPFNIDLAASGLDPEKPITSCELGHARVLMSLSGFSGSIDDLLAEARASAAAQGRPEPQRWHDVVLDRAMYDFLFRDHVVVYPWHATFAYMAIQLDPICGGARYTIRTEEQLVGFVQEVAP